MKNQKNNLEIFNAFYNEKHCEKVNQQSFHHEKNKAFQQYKLGMVPNE